MRTFFIAAVALLASTRTHSAALEQWECKDLISPTEVLVTATVNEGRKSGTISVAGVTHATIFKVAGFDRRWDFGEDQDGSYTYAFIISPDGTGSYYDFSSSNSVKPSMLMKCRQRSVLKDKK